MSGILAVDPGTTKSGWCWLHSGKPSSSGVWANADVLLYLKSCVPPNSILVVETFASMGMRVGQEVFDACRWAGRFQQAWYAPEEVRLVYRRTVKMHLCQSMRAKDADIRQVLIDRFGPPGTKKSPGATFGITGDAWSALALAVTVYDTERKDGIRTS